MFGDFERQMLYGQDREQAEALIRLKCGNFATGSLRVNCRNTPRIATLSSLLGRLTPNYSRILRPDDYIEPTIIYYSTPSQQRRELINAIVRLQKDSYTNEEIVVLSSKGSAHCVASKIDDEIWSNSLAQYNNAKTDQIRYSSIHRFKGLDSPAIVVTDIEKIESDKFSSLFYVATTRALERLIILVHETAKPGIIKSLTEPN
jgi:superfamily I DNA/RNA helicase